jgi:hypothetical protein
VATAEESRAAPGNEISFPHSLVRIAHGPESRAVPAQESRGCSQARLYIGGNEQGSLSGIHDRIGDRDPATRVDVHQDGAGSISQAGGGLARQRFRRWQVPSGSRMGLGFFGDGP